MRPQKEPDNNPFIIFTTSPSSAKVDPATRKRVRSHVMRGKNRKTAPVHAGAEIGSWINGREDPDASLRSVPANRPRIYLPVGGILTQFHFADEMTPYMRELTFKWFTVIKDSWYPTEACLAPHDSPWAEYLTYDRAYLHLMLSSSQAFFDFARDVKLGTKSIYHLNKSLHVLREHLAVAELATSDSTISTVMNLAVFAGILGDPHAAKQHMQGLCHLVNLRGGIRDLRPNTELQSKVLRTDLTLALSTGSKPLLFIDGFSWDPYLSRSSLSKNPKTAKSRTAQTLQTLCPSDPRLQNVALDLQEFSLAANLAFQTGRKIPAALYRETLVSVQYRLLALRDEADDASPPAASPPAASPPAQPQHDVLGSSLDADTENLLRLGMLAFTTTLFLQIKLMPIRYADLARRVRACVEGMLVQNPPAEQGGVPVQVGRLRLWFLFVARTSVLSGAEDEEALVRATVGVVEGLGFTEEVEWQVVREVLREFMWIDWVRPKEGVVFWERLVAAREELR
ncbi:hypothetical protein C8A01DRAFT_46960 [Parachaetomium inaequale]|uniref:Tachykinin family protein n=1 Tax=Parachaetomium inaequale TaxID=2588326 RepID=A0AAN6PII0_9PEZI|nr:hypothetical protein C8A01DRAFT_46960 [Parachaetomium inaequale]